jgi:hypothetical protein
VFETEDGAFDIPFGIDEMLIAALALGVVPRYRNRKWILTVVICFLAAIICSARVLLS